MAAQGEAEQAAVVTMSSLGRIGRFGNQFFQYAFLRHYARRHALAVQTPPWVGQELFGHHDPAISRQLPVVYEMSWDVEKALLTRLEAPVQNADLWGYFLLPTSYYASEKNWLQGLLQPVGEVAAAVKQAAARLRERGETIVGIHQRRGDKSTGRHAVTPVAAYRTWLSARWPSLPSPVLFVASDDPSVAAEFAEFNPVVASDLGETKPAFYLDFYLLTQCDRLAISNSTFSFAAAMLNERCAEFVRPMPETGELVAFDPWNARPVMRDDLKARDYYDALLKRATAATTEAAYRAVRRELADNWIGTGGDEGTLTEGYFGPLGQAHRQCMRSPLRELPLDESERAYHQELLATLGRGLPADWFASYVLAAMLYCRPQEMRFPVDLAAMPQFLREDYLSFLSGAAR